MRKDEKGMKRLSRREKSILDNLDRLLNGQPLQPPAGFVEEKILQALNSFAYTREKSAKEQENISRLISDISHQLKTPLSALTIHLELAGDDALSPAERAAALTECQRQAGKISFLSEAVFKIARLEAGLISVMPERVDLIPTIHSAASAIQAVAAQRGLSFQLNMPQSLTVPHDPIWTKEAIVNILDNAAKYTKSGGITLSVEQAAIYTRIDIADTGIGLDPKEYTKVFERFYRSDRSRQVEGTGLGLCIAREILRQQGGNITVASNGTGCTFSLFLQNC